MTDQVLPIPHADLREYFDITKGSKRQRRVASHWGNKFGACDVLWMDGNGSIRWLESNGCHGVMNQWPATPNMKCLYSSLWCRYPDLWDAALDYWGYLLDPEKSPFKGALKKIDKVYTEEGKLIAFGFLDFNIPAQLCVPLMMQCRVPSEHSSKLRSYWHWRKSGFKEFEALYLSECLPLDESFTLKMETQSYAHAFPGIETDIRKLAGCAPVISEGLVMNRKGSNIYAFQYGPVHLCWSGKKDNVWNHVKGESAYTGVFPKTFAKLESQKLKHKVAIVSLAAATAKLLETRDKWSVAQ